MSLPILPEPVPVLLAGRHVRLEPLTRDHHAALCAAGLPGEVFRWYTHPPATPADMARFIDDALAAQAAGTALPFATTDRKTGTVMGSSRLGNIDRANRRVEIGWTWLGEPWQRGPWNTEAKLLMLTHAFEVLGCVRVEFKTDSLNARSRAALARIGATEEGTLRNHMVCADGRLRHSVYFSILESEWPAAKARLIERLDG
jgi:RimJ/RimL family protein N-acetyltransferase